MEQSAIMSETFTSSNNPILVFTLCKQGLIPCNFFHAFRSYCWSVQKLTWKNCSLEFFYFWCLLQKGKVHRNFIYFCLSSRGTVPHVWFSARNWITCRPFSASLTHFIPLCCSSGWWLMFRCVLAKGRDDLSGNSYNTTNFPQTLSYGTNNGKITHNNSSSMYSPTATLYLFSFLLHLLWPS